MNDSSNPYRPPIDLAKALIVADLNWHELPNGRLDFSFQLTPADVHRYVTPRQSYWWPILLAVVTATLVFVVLVRGTTARFALDPWLLTLVGLSWALFIFVLLMQRLLGKQSIAQSPSVLESTIGYLNARGILTATANETAFNKWESIRRITVNDHCVVLSSDNWRQIGIILPWSSFEDPSAARAALESVSKQITVDTSMAIDERLRLPPDDETMFAPPDPHVSFRGEIKIGEITNAFIGNKIRRSIWRIFIVCAVAILLALTTLFFGWLYVAVVGLPIGIFAAWLMIRVYKHPLYSADADSVAFRLEGWFSEDAYFVRTFLAQTVREYAGLQACSLDETMICLRLPGSIDAWQFIPRTMFSSDADFRRVSEWVQSAVIVADRGKGPSGKG